MTKVIWGTHLYPQAVGKAFRRCQIPAIVRDFEAGVPLHRHNMRIAA